MSANRIWYYTAQGASRGPETWDGLVSAVRNGQLAADADVWFPGLKHWIPARQIPGVHAPAIDAEVNEARALSGTIELPPPINSHRTKTTQHVAGARASRGARSLAFVIESAALLFLAFTVTMLFVLVGILTKRETAWQSAQVYTRVELASVIVCFVLLITLEIRNAGTSVGKHLIGLRVVRTTGNRVSATRLALRTMVRFFIVLACVLIIDQTHLDLWILFSILGVVAIVLPFVVLPGTRALHDYLFDTKVERM